jgi:hypothetical protein
MNCKMKGVEPFRCINCDLRFMARPAKAEPGPPPK